MEVDEPSHGMSQLRSSGSGSHPSSEPGRMDIDDPPQGMSQPKSSGSGSHSLSDPHEREEGRQEIQVVTRMPTSICAHAWQPTFVLPIVGPSGTGKAQIIYVTEETIYDAEKSKFTHLPSKQKSRCKTRLPNIYDAEKSKFTHLPSKQKYILPREYGIPAERSSQTGERKLTLQLTSPHLELHAAFEVYQKRLMESGKLEAENKLVSSSPTVSSMSEEMKMRTALVLIRDMQTLIMTYFLSADKRPKVVVKSINDKGSKSAMSAGLKKEIESVQSLVGGMTDKQLLGDPKDIIKSLKSATIRDTANNKLRIVVQVSGPEESARMLLILSLFNESRRVEVPWTDRDHMVTEATPGHLYVRYIPSNFEVQITKPKGAAKTAMQKASSYSGDFQQVTVNEPLLKALHQGASFASPVGNLTINTSPKLDAYVNEGVI
jgi:hypothetical protein